MAVLSDHELEAVTRSLGKKKAAARIVALCNTGPCLTGYIVHKAGCLNISQYKKPINEALFKHGVYLHCRPKIPYVVNVYGDISRQHYWELLKFEAPAINDEAGLTSNEKHCLSV